MNKIILEYRFTTHQRITLLVYVGLPLLIAFYLKTNYFLSPSLHQLLVPIFALFGFFFLVSFSFLKRGFIVKEGNLFKGLFLVNIMIYKTKIELKERNKIAILKLRKSQKFSEFTAAKPDLAYQYNAFEVSLLNEKHTKREVLISLENKNNSDNLVHFLSSKLNFKLEKYKPNFN